MERIIRLLAVAMLLNTSCTKDFLDKKPNKSLVVPSSLENFQAILDNSFNVFGVSPFMNQIADGDFYVTENGIPSLANLSRNIYLWQDDIYEGATSTDWNRMYEQVFYANIVLEGLEKIKGNPDQRYMDRLRGTALFCRAYAYYNLAQEFTPPYHAERATSDLGLPLRTSADVNSHPNRASLQDTYQLMIDDIQQAELLLPITVEPKTRPTKAAAWALLARITLSMADYETALHAADKALSFQNDLMDFNTLDTVAASPFPSGRSVYNKEIIYYTDRIFNTFYNSANTRVVEVLLNEYNDSDLRKLIFFNNGRFKGSYGGSALFIFTGLATDELYLIRAECYARTGRTAEARDDLTQLMRTRWKKDRIYNVPTDLDEGGVLQMILSERRKELLTRGTRWSDLRRLNQEEMYKTTLKRNYQGVEYLLSPGDPRYVFPIAMDELELGGIEQNPR